MATRLTTEGCWEMCCRRVGRDEHLTGESERAGGAWSGKFGRMRSGEGEKTVTEWPA